MITKNQITREDGVYLANTKFIDLSGETKYLAVFIFFLNEYMIFIAYPSDETYAFSSDISAKIKELKNEIYEDIRNSRIQSEESISPFEIITNNTVFAEFSSGNAKQEITLSRDILGLVSYSLNQKYDFFMDFYNPSNSGPKNYNLIKNCSLKFIKF